MAALVVFTGNCPKNVNRDAKYGVHYGSEGPVVGLLYRNENGEQWHPTSEDHPDLVDMVNAVKLLAGGTQNGPFYINEFGQVIVPAGLGARYYLAGEYDGLVEFEFEDNVLSGRGVDLAGNPLQAGDAWTGPHPGIPYVLRAGGGDVYYDSILRPQVTKREWLSDHVGAGNATTFANRVREYKGSQGGRFYINEWREIFAPVNDTAGLRYVYVGHLELDDPWFPQIG